MSFQGKTVIVTGSSTGIGKAALIQFALKGANVVIHGQSEAKLQVKFNKLNDTVYNSVKNVLFQKVVCELQALKIPSNRYIVVQGPIQEDSTQEKLINNTLKAFKRIDVLINNAGVSAKNGVEDVSVENIDFVFTVNLKA